MKHSWMLDVLADLSVYAQKNDLTALAEQLDDTRHVAVAEFVSLSGGEPQGKDGGEPLGARHEARVGGAI